MEHYLEIIFITFFILSVIFILQIRNILRKVPFSIAITCLILVCLLTILITAFAGIVSIESKNLDKLIKFFGVLSDIILAITALLTAFCAYIGLRRWHNQIKYGRHITIIWDCLLAIREFRTAKSRWHAGKLAVDISNDQIIDTSSADRENVYLAVQKIQEKFRELDVIVIRNGDEWATHALAYSSYFTSLNLTFDNYQKKRFNIHNLNGRIAETNSKIDTFSDKLIVELTVLEDNIYNQS